MNDKIIVNLIGGVGNQLFQYAMGYCVSRRSGLPLYIDKEGFDDYELRMYELQNFNLTVNHAIKEDILLLKKKHILNKTLYKDKYHVKNSYLKVRHSAYFLGFWQSEKYFCDFRDDILKLYTFKDLSFLKNIQLLNDIRSCNSVSIHVRLGDYVNNENTRKKFFVCTKKYYKGAIEYIKNKVPNAKFYVFSDDMESAKEYLPKGFDYVFTNTSCWQEDMYLMQNAKHNIIPNSSFGWWCAYLNQNPDKIVTAPKRWYTKSTKTPYNDVVPKSWVKIQVD